MYLIFIIVLFVIWYVHTPQQNYRYGNSRPVYLNMDLKSLCGQADNVVNNETKMNIQNIKEEYEKKLNKCNKNTYAEKKRADAIYLRYADPEINSIDYLFYGNDDSIISGDDKLMYKMYDMGQKNKEAMINRALWNKNNLIPYFEEELNNHANSIWYDDDSLEIDF